MSILLIFSQPLESILSRRGEFWNHALIFGVTELLAIDLRQVETSRRLAGCCGPFFWESFIFQCRGQSRRLKQLLSEYPAGRLRVIDMRFCFPHLSLANFRFAPERGGVEYQDHACLPRKGP